MARLEFIPSGFQPHSYHVQSSTNARTVRWTGTHAFPISNGPIPLELHELSLIVQTAMPSIVSISSVRFMEL